MPRSTACKPAASGSPTGPGRPGGPARRAGPWTQRQQQGLVRDRRATRETHRVYALDFRGHGLSDWPGRYSFELFRDDLHAFMEARNLSGATLVGHSMGGSPPSCSPSRSRG
ncbi:alpha/beta fold hydrolase [Streptomyces sp. M10(2022)]